MHMKKGFTLAEILVVITILVLVSGIVLASIRGYIREQALSGTVASITAVLSDARTQTLSGNAGAQYGVHFETDSVTLFSGATYSEGAAGNEVITLDSRVILADINLGGGSDVVFEKLTGDADGAGTLTIELAADASRQKIITIHETGLVSYD